MNTDSKYNHTQKGIIKPLLIIAAAGCLIGLIFTWNSPVIFIQMAASAVCLTLAFCFGYLTVKDSGDSLSVSFGPLTFFKKKILYRHITSVQPFRSSFLAGWGIHYTRHGWLWNISGFDCVKIEMGEKQTLIGTNDPKGLVSFLQSKISGANRQNS